MTDDEVIKYLRDIGYFELRSLPDGRFVGIVPFMFTTAIITIERQSMMLGYEDRWCYHTMADAKAALENWDGTGEPKGWHRHPKTGRRVDDDGREYVMP